LLIMAPSTQELEPPTIPGRFSGLGEAVVKRLAKRAPLTIGFHNNESKARLLANDIRDAGGAAEVEEVDIAQGDSVNDFLRTASECWDGLDAIISSTGPAIPLCPLSEITEEDFRRIYDIDVLGSFNVFKHGSEILKQCGGGSIVVFLTTAVLRTLENDGMSGCPKTAVSALLKQTAREMGSANIRCNGVAPGVIDAGIVHSSFAITETAQNVIIDCLDKTPLGRMGTPSEVAALVDFLVSPEAAYISGQIIGIDGGYSA
jgi:3-oxoacyl-[acyl-carrier protein] reductase